MLLGVNIDHIATVRNARGTIYPSPVEAALIAETHGADLITMHLREDRRHIKDADVFAVKNAIRTRLNLEMALTEEMLENALNVMPEDVCLVPEKRQEVTTEGGLDVLAQQDKVAEFTKILTDAGIRVSLFIDADNAQIQAAYDVGAPVIELHTGAYADAHSHAEQMKQFERIQNGAHYASDLGLVVKRRTRPDHSQRDADCSNSRYPRVEHRPFADFSSTLPRLARSGPPNEGSHVQGQNAALTASIIPAKAISFGRYPHFQTA